MTPKVAGLFMALLCLAFVAMIVQAAQIGLIVRRAQLYKVAQIKRRQFTFLQVFLSLTY